MKSQGIAVPLERAYGISDRVVNGLAAHSYLDNLFAASDVPLLVATDGATNGQPGTSLGITPQRDLGPQADWNAWVDASYLDVRDERYGLSTDGHAGGAILGVDRLIRDDLVVGLAVGIDDVQLSDYHDTVDLSYDGYFGGPYLGYRITEGVVLDAWLGYGQYDADSRISILDGGYDFSRWFGSLNLTGQYRYDEYRFRPKLTLFYAEDDIDDAEYGLRGIPALAAFSVRTDGGHERFGLIDASVEVNRLWSLSDDLLLQPYSRFGVRYDFERPNDGELITPGLARVRPSAWSGNVRLGVKALIDDQLIIDASGGYLSIGQNGLDVWGGRLSLSWLF